MKKKGFTLIELLAVIVILAIIALIATPMIMNVIEKARRGAAIESVNGIVDAAEKYQLLEMMDNNEAEKTFDLTEDKLQYKGGKPESGTLQINDQGKIYVIAKYGNYCIEKGYNDERPQIIESETCEMTVEEKDIVISAESYHAMKIDEEGNLWGWGENFRGQLGDGTTEDKEEPVQIKSGTKFQCVSTGLFHTMAIDENGNLWSWGFNWDGQLGVETPTDEHGNMISSLTPIPIKEGTKFKSVSAGENRTMAIDENGNLWGWGDNEYSQLGDGTTEKKTEPVQIKEGTKFKSVSAGGGHTMATDAEGNLWGWGWNAYGQLGDGTEENKIEPIQIKEGTKFKSVSAGYKYTMAIDENGNLWGWGDNEYGQLGDGTEENKTEPVQINEGTKFKSVSAGRNHTMAIDIEGNLWGWGYNGKGQLGIETPTDEDGNMIPSLNPIQIPTGTKFKSVSAGGWHTVVSDSNNNIYTLGELIRTPEV